METILDIYALGIQSARMTARQIFDYWMREDGNCVNRKKMLSRAACLNDSLKKELFKLI